MRQKSLSGISSRFRKLSRSYRQVAHVLLTRPPLDPLTSSRRNQLVSLARLACIRHAASVRPEPRSNSPKKVCLNEQRSFILAFHFRGLKHCFFPLHRLFCSVFKEQITNCRKSA